MPFLKALCPTCKKPAITDKQFSIQGKLVSKLKCGHLLIGKQLVTEKGPESIVSIDGKRLFKFQCEGVKHFDASGGRLLIADAMGLGKTIQAQAIVALHPDMLPCLMFVKSGLKTQWMLETMRWQGEEEFPYMLESSTDDFTPGYNFYIMSMDLMTLKDKKLKNGKILEASFVKMFESFKKRGIKSIIIDECQLLKNHESKRAKTVRMFCEEVPYVVALSGTPIKNHAGEYFSILNILRPELYPVYARFIQNECVAYSNGYGYKVGGLKNPEHFKDKTKHFIIRRTREEVLPDLPVITRNFSYADLGDAVEKLYAEEMRQFCNYMDGNDDEGTMERKSKILAYLSRMRHLTGIAKRKPVVEFLERFLSETERKIVVFCHHIDVADTLKNMIEKMLKNQDEEDGSDFSKLKCLTLYEGDRDKTIEVFRNDPDARIMIASTLASGEGLNLQFCSDCIMMERQWNPPNEEQAECRFIRIGQTELKVTATYFLAVGTVDEFFTEIVEKKREIVNGTLDGLDVPWDETSLIRELAEVVRAKGGARWSL